jgi:two-component system phosphate regulon sensor histidine kinase PhoR
MLEISEINNNINLEETDLNYEVLTLVNDYKLKVHEPDSLSFDPHGSEILMMMDPFVFTTMLQNILDNSFKYNHSDIKMTELFITEDKGGHILLSRITGTELKIHLKKKYSISSSVQAKTILFRAWGLDYITLNNVWISMAGRSA